MSWYTAPVHRPLTGRLPVRLLLTAVAWGAVAAQALDPLDPLRTAAAVLTVFLVPGAALLRLVAHTRRGVRFFEPLESVLLAAALSLSLTAVASEVFFIAGEFTVERVLFTLACLTGATALCPLPRPRPRAV